MQRDRVMSWSEARSDYRPPPRRAAPRPRAAVLPTDPAWLHEGLTMRLMVKGEPTDVFTVSAMAAATNRTTDTVRRLIRSGVIPDTPFRAPGRGSFGQKRLWPRAVVLATARAVEELSLQSRPRRWAGSELPLRLRHPAT